MSLTEFQRRAVRQNSKVALMAKLVMPDSTAIYLVDYDGPFAMLRNAIGLNAVILSVSGLGASDISRTTTISIECVNKKLNHQAGNPLVTPVKFSDLIASGLDRATVEVKAAIAGAVDIAIASWSDSHLASVFKGRMQGRPAYDDGTITLRAVAWDRAADVEYPIERVREETTLEKTAAVVPVVFGDLTAESLGEVVIQLNAPWPGEATSNTIPVIPDCAGGKANLFDSTKGIVVHSSQAICLDYPTGAFGDFPSGVILPRGSALYTDPDHPTWTMTQFPYQSITFAPTVRMDGNPLHTTTTYDHEDIGPRGSLVNLAAGETLAVATPVVSNTAGATMLALEVYLEISMPEGAQIECWLTYAERTPTTHHVHDYDHIFLTRGSIIGRGMFLPAAYVAGFVNWLIDEGTDARHDNTAVRTNWVLFGDGALMRIYMIRRDAGTEPVVIRGIHAIPVGEINYGGYKSVSELTSRFEAIGNLGTYGQGLPDSTDAARYHPSPIIASVLADLMGFDPATLDFPAPGLCEGTEGWRFGFSLAAPTKGADLLAQLQEQATAKICIDSDGKYRLRMLARHGGNPAWQRYSRTLVLGQEVSAVAVDPQGADWVKNVIVVNYAQREDGTYSRTAWVRGTGRSDDGYGNRTPGLEAISQASIADYDEQRDEIDAWAIRDAVTARGFIADRLVRQAFPPSKVTFTMTRLALDIPIGMILQCDPASFDAKLLFNGVTWAGKYFQVETITSSGVDTFTVVATEAPSVDAGGITMVPRRVVVVS